MTDNTTLKPSERMKITRQEMPSRDAVEAAGCFEEVNLGMGEQLAVQEARRCLDCKDAKCIRGCPVQIDIPGFIRRVAEGDLPGAAGILLRDNALPSISGRVCPQEKQCEAQCVRGKGCGSSVAIGHLERYVADWAQRRPASRAASIAAPSGFKVAIVGSGPAGLTAAGELARPGPQRHRLRGIA